MMRETKSSSVAARQRYDVGKYKSWREIEWKEFLHPAFLPFSARVEIPTSRPLRVKYLQATGI